MQEEIKVKTLDEINHELYLDGISQMEIDKPSALLLRGVAEDVLTVYGALRAYLKVLTQQPEEDLETIVRVTRLMIEIKPQAVEASQEIARRDT